MYEDYYDEKLYSTGFDDLDSLMEKAFCDGYEYAQREFTSSSKSPYSYSLTTKEKKLNPTSKIKPINNRGSVIHGSEKEAVKSAENNMLSTVSKSSNKGLNYVPKSTTIIHKFEQPPMAEKNSKKLRRLIKVARFI